MEKTGSNYIRGIDGLRAVAVLMVLAYHLKLPFAGCGLLGVTVFFVISGFLITRILITEIVSTGTVNLKNFWVKRIRRLLPAVLTMIIALIFASAVFDRVLFTKTCEDLWPTIFLYNNWHQILNQVSYFENAGAPSPLTHCWSLAIEAQFYLVYPVLLLVIGRFKKRKAWLAGVTIALAAASLGLMWFLFDPAKDPSRVYYGTDTRAFSLLFGGLLAQIESVGSIEKRLPGILRDIAGVISLIVLLGMMAAVDGYAVFLYKGGQGIASLLAVLMIYAVLNHNGVLNKLFSLSPLVWIGERSYGIYLWHYPVMLLISGGRKAAWWMMLVEVLLTGVCAALSYRFIETPIRHGAIGRNIAIMRSQPKTGRERKKQIRTIWRNAEVVSGALLIGIGAMLCVAYVPRERALGDVDKMKKNAENAYELTSQKTAQLKHGEKGSSGAEAKKEKKNLTEEELLANLKLLLIGDSIALDVTDVYYETFADSISDTEIGRNAVESVDIYDSYVQENGWNGDGVIFALGSNGPLYDTLPALREKMGREKPLFLVTIRAPHEEWEDSNNQEMRQFAEETEHTYVIDWYKASEGKKEWFDEDGTHLLPEGARAYRDCIRRAVLKVYAD